MMQLIEILTIIMVWLLILKKVFDVWNLYRMTKTNQKELSDAIIELTEEVRNVKLSINALDMYKQPIGWEILEDEQADLIEDF